jgi:hypothetical protein
MVQDLKSSPYVVQLLSRGVVVQEHENKTPLVNFPLRFSFKMSLNCTSRDY